MGEEEAGGEGGEDMPESDRDRLFWTDLARVRPRCDPFHLGFISHNLSTEWF